MKTQARVAPSESDRRRGWLLGLAALLAVSGLAALVWGGLRLADPATLPLRKVRVEGEFRHLEASHLQTVVAGLVSGGFFSVDVEQVRQGLMKEPWVENVVVRRVWPDGLLLKVFERAPYAYWGQDALLTREGEVFRPPRHTFPQGLVALEGPPGTEKLVLERLEQLRTLIAPLQRPVTRLVLNERRAWSFTLAGGPTVIVGRSSFEPRVTRMAQQLTRATGSRWNAIEEVDLRYTNGFAIRVRRGGAAPSAVQPARAVAEASGQPRT